MILTQTKKCHLLILLSLYALTACKTELYHDLAEQEANEMLAFLLTAKIDAEKIALKGDKFGINVEEDHFAQAVILLRNEGYPRTQFEGVGKMFESDSRISSSLEQRARLNHALTQELSQTLSVIDGVLTARVHAALPEESSDRKTKEINSAAVFIRYDGRYDITDLTPRIKNLVAQSLAHVSYKDIAVVLIPAERLPIPVIKPHKKDSPPSFMQTLMTHSILMVALILLVSALIASVAWWMTHRSPATTQAQGKES